MYQTGFNIYYNEGWLHVGLLCFKEIGLSNIKIKVIQIGC